MNIWVSSDFHINHQNISGKNQSKWDKGYRDFSSLDEMNKAILKGINNNVKEDDILYFLGDFCFGNHKLTSVWRNEIKCKTIHVCKGNHDSHIDDYKDSFTSIQDVLTVKHGKNTFFFSHYSHRIWLGSHKGFIHCYGHSHNSIPDYGKSMDVGIDVAYGRLGEYRPFRIEEIISIMDKKEITFVDNHGSKTNVY